MSVSSAPIPPDPKVVAQETAAGNKATAIAQYGLNATNQYGPQGTLTYNQIGKWEDDTPRFESRQEYTPGEQQVYDTNLRTRQNVGAIGENQSQRIGDILNTPFKLNNEATEGRLAELGRARLDPLLAQRRAGLETKLSNQGITDPGSEAYRAAMRSLGEQENDAYNQLFLTGRSQANLELLTERNQPINEISALMGGSQVSQPNFAQTPSVPVQPTDTAGIYSNNFNQQMANYNATNSRNNAMMGGIFGMASPLLGRMFM